MKPASLERQSRAIERWKVTRGILGRDYVPVNRGARRTTSKKALLSAIRAEARDKGLAPIFAAQF
jgi:hypothetical protein